MKSFPNAPKSLFNAPVQIARANDALFQFKRDYIENFTKTWQTAWVQTVHPEDVDRLGQPDVRTVQGEICSCLFDEGEFIVWMEFWCDETNQYRLAQVF